MDHISKALDAEIGIDKSDNSLVINPNVTEERKLELINEFNNTDIETVLLDDEDDSGFDEDDSDISELIEHITSNNDSTGLIPVNQEVGHIIQHEVQVSEKDIKYEEDLELVKDNIRTLIERSMEAVDDMFITVREAERASAFESAAVYMKTVVELNEKLIDITNKDRKASSAPANGNQNNGTQINNQTNIVVQSPRNVLKNIKKRRG